MNGMDAVIVSGASAEEIAALAVALQGRRELVVADDSAIRALAQATYDRQQGLQGQPGS